jgi:hypothetical protein
MSTNHPVANRSTSEIGGESLPRSMLGAVRRCYSHPRSSRSQPCLTSLAPAQHLQQPNARASRPACSQALTSARLRFIDETNLEKIAYSMLIWQRLGPVNARNVLGNLDRRRSHTNRDTIARHWRTTLSNTIAKAHATAAQQTKNQSFARHEAAASYTTKLTNRPKASANFQNGMSRRRAMVYDTLRTISQAIHYTTATKSRSPS